MFRSLRTISILICLAMLFSSIYAVQKAKAVKSKSTKPAQVEVAAKPVIKVPEADILVEYDGGMITKKDLEAKISKIPAQSQSRYKTVEGQEQVLDMMTVEDIFYQKAKDMNILNDAAVLDKISSAKKQVILQDYYKRNINNKVNITEADKREYFSKNQKDFYVQPYITIQYIQPADEALALKAMNELKKGVPFDTVSAHYSINTYAKGLHGKIKNIRLNGNYPGIGDDAELDDLISKSPVDTVNYLGPQQTITGWSIIRILEKIEGKQRPYNECESEIEPRLRPVKESELLNKFVETQKKLYNVVIDSLTLNLINLREPKTNTDYESKNAISSSLASLNMTVKSLLDKFGKLSQQEQMMYIKGGGASHFASQELTRALMYNDALKDKSYEDSLAVNEEYKQTERYYVLQEAYKKLVVDQVVVTPTEVREYYDTHLDSYTTPSARKIQAIWCKDMKTAKQAHKKFTKAVKKNNKKQIAELVKKYSVKPTQEIIDNLYHNGVVTGVGPDQNLSDQIWATPLKGVSPIVKTVRNEILFFTVIEERPPFVKSFVEMEPRVTTQLKKEKEKTQMETVKEQLFTNYNLKKYPEKLSIKLSPDEMFDMADNASRQKKYKDSILYYDQIIKFYPNGRDDYKAFFMKAFLVSEEMNNKEEGLKLFKEFLQKYSSGELNESAQYMIDELEGRHPVMDDLDEFEED